MVGRLSHDAVGAAVLNAHSLNSDACTLDKRGERFALMYLMSSVAELFIAQVVKSRTECDLRLWPSFAVNSWRSKSVLYTGRV